MSCPIKNGGSFQFVFCKRLPEGIPPFVRMDAFPKTKILSFGPQGYDPSSSLCRCPFFPLTILGDGDARRGPRYLGSWCRTILGNSPKKHLKQCHRFTTHPGNGGKFTTNHKMGKFFLREFPGCPSKGEKPPTMMGGDTRKMG